MVEDARHLSRSSGGIDRSEFGMRAPPGRAEAEERNLGSVLAKAPALHRRVPGPT
jgi:hypothetical protein